MTKNKRKKPERFNLDEIRLMKEINKELLEIGIDRPEIAEAIVRGVKRSLQESTSREGRS